MFSTYSLFKKESTYDTYGNEKALYKLMHTIEVQVSIKQITPAIGEVIYNLYQVTGLTSFNNFNPKEHYKIKNEQHEYIVEHVIPSRLTTLVLKEVI